MTHHLAAAETAFANTASGGDLLVQLLLAMVMNHGSVPLTQVWLARLLSCVAC